MKSGIELIQEERQRQIEVEGWSAGHDAEHDGGELAIAAACYASPVPIRAEVDIPCNCREASCRHLFGRTGTAWRDPWPWDSEWDKRGKHDRLRQLAEIDRLQSIRSKP